MKLALYAFWMAGGVIGAVPFIADALEKRRRVVRFWWMLLDLAGAFACLWFAAWALLRGVSP